MPSNNNQRIYHLRGAEACLHVRKVVNAGRLLHAAIKRVRPLIRRDILRHESGKVTARHVERLVESTANNVQKISYRRSIQVQSTRQFRASWQQLKSFPGSA